MIAHDERQAEKDAAQQQGGDAYGHSSDGNAGATSESSVGDDLERAAAALADGNLAANPVEMIREDLPGVHAVRNREPGEEDWQNASTAARVSAAGPAPAVPDVAAPAPGDAGAGGTAVEVNPQGYGWESLVSVSEAHEMRQTFEGWRDKPN